MEPGIYPDVEWDEYCRTPGLNASRLKWGLLSGRHLQAALNGEYDDKDTPDRLLGRAIHARLLEPSAYRDRYHVASTCQALVSRKVDGEKVELPCGNAGKYLFRGQWLCGVHCPREAREMCEEFHGGYVLTEEQARAVEAAAAAVKGHEVVRLLRQRGGCEVTLLWDRDGERCKARLDKLIPAGPLAKDVVLDLKKVQPGAVDVESVSRQVANYNYDFSAAWYCDGHERLTGRRPRFVWLFQESGVPYETLVLEADGETLEVGRRKCERAWGVYAACRESGEWPGMPRRVLLGGVPEWERRRWLGW